MAIQATGTGCVVEVSSGGALNTQFFPTETYHYQFEVFYDYVRHYKHILFNDNTVDVGTTSTPAHYVYIGSRLRFPDYTASLDITNASTNTTIGNIIGTINVVLGGAGGKIAVYATS